MTFSLSSPPESFVQRSSSIFHVDQCQFNSPIVGSEIRAYLASFPKSDSFEKDLNDGNGNVCCGNEEREVDDFSRVMGKIHQYSEKGSLIGNKIFEFTESVGNQVKEKKIVKKIQCSWSTARTPSHH